MRAVFICGGTLTAAFLQEFIAAYTDAVVYAVDGGLAVAEEAGVVPDYLIGDFDTAPEVLVQRYESRCVIVRHKPEKDATDTELALDMAIQNGATELFLLGAIGSRMDHTMANVHMLYHAIKQGKKAWIVNENNRLSLHAASFTERKEKLFGTYVSFLPFFGEVTGVTLTGFKYPLYEKTLTAGSSIGISNEVLEETIGVTFSHGYLLMIEARD